MITWLMDYFRRLHSSTGILAIRHQHYSSTMHERLMRFGHVVIIVLSLTSILAPLLVSLLIRNALEAAANVLVSWASIVVLQVLGVAWVVPQIDSITGHPYEKFSIALPLSRLENASINLTVLLEADALLLLLWVVASGLLFTGAVGVSSSGHDTFQILIVFFLLLSAQTVWIWNRSNLSAFILVLLLDTSIVTLFHYLSDLQSVALPALAAAFIVVVWIDFVVCSGSLKLPFVRRSNLSRRVGNSGNFDFSRYHRIFVTATLIRFYMNFLWNGVRGRMLLRIMIATVIWCSLLLLSHINVDYFKAGSFWFIGISIGVTIVTGMAQDLKVLHGATTPYRSSLPIKPSLLLLTDGLATLAVVCLIVAVWVSISVALFHSNFGLYCAALPFGIIVASCQYLIGVKFNRQRVLVSLIANIILLISVMFILWEYATVI